MQMPAAKYYADYLNGVVELYRDQLANNYVSDKGIDISLVIRGRIYAVEDIKQLEVQLDEYAKIKTELAQLESEGYTTPVPKQN